MNLQELITRGRHIFSDAPSRLAVFNAVNGKLTAGDMASKLNRSANSVRNDLIKIKNASLIQETVKKDGNALIKNGFSVYEKIPLARTVSLKLFSDTAKRPKQVTPTVTKGNKRVSRNSNVQKSIPIPNEQMILDICNHGENQFSEFKGQEANVQKIVREVAAFANTEHGGIVFFGIDDDGTIEGTGITRQKFDQSLQNSIRSNISPALTVRLKEVHVMGSSILMIIVPPWNRKDVYHHGERVLIRKGTNVFAVKPDESRKLHDGTYIV